MAVSDMGGPWTQKRAFATVDELVKSWSLGEYQHHVQLIRDRAEQGTDFQVIFSIPKPTKAVPDYVATATFTVMPPRAEGDAPRTMYTVESQRQRLPSKQPIRKQWLDSAIKRKKMVASATSMFNTTGKLPPPVAFVPGMYKLDLSAQAMDGVDDTEDRLFDAMAQRGEAQDVAARNYMESAEELENLLVGIFNDGDADGNGYLEPQEFFNLLETSNLGLSDIEKRQLLAIADANGDGKIEYAEFAPLGADIVQTMRARHLNEAEQVGAEAQAEMRARAALHNMGMEEVTQHLLSEFRKYDKDGSGRLERGEIVEALNNLTLGHSKLTPREIRMVMTYIDEDQSGTVEYNEFAPLMFDYLVEALKLGFMQSELSDLANYLTDHLSYYDMDEDGFLSRNELKTALIEADVISLTPIQVASVLADAQIDPAMGSVEIATFVGPASNLIQKVCDPQLEYKRKQVSQMAKVTPLGALTPEEKQRLAELALTVFRNYDTDGSGKLDRVEFFSCLKEAQLGFTDHEIQQLMYASDEDADGNISYQEFADLFDGYILEMARLDKIDKLIEGQEASELSAELMRFIDELMIPLRLAFDILCEGGESTSSGAIVQKLLIKGPEWDVSEEAINMLCEAVVTRGDEPPIEWPHLVEIIEKLAFNQESTE